jgi:hypothetical protein
MREPVPLHRVQAAIFEFCRGRADVTVFGAQAVNLYVGEPRMTADVDLLSPDPATTARSLAGHLHATLRIAARVREVKPGRGYRVYQQRKDGRRHLADVRIADMPLDDAVERDGVRYVSIPLAVAMKVCAYARRRLAPKGATDLADLRRLLLAHPELRDDAGPVSSALEHLTSDASVRSLWRDLASAPPVSDEDVDDGY